MECGGSATMRKAVISKRHVLHFLLVAGPQLNAVVLQGSARFAQGSRKVFIVQLGRCQKPESR